MIDKETIAVYNAQIEQYKKLTLKEKADKNLIQFVEYLPKNAYVLDLGCGPAASSNYIRSKGHHVDPIDASAEMVKSANEVFDIGARQATFEDIKSINEYDGVWANFSLLHASLETFPIYLEAIAKALKTDGVFHIGMKLKTGAESVKRDALGRKYIYFGQLELEDHLKAVSLMTLSISTGELIGMAGEIEPWIVILSKKASNI